MRSSILNRKWPDTMTDTSRVRSGSFQSFTNRDRIPSKLRHSDSFSHSPSRNSRNNFDGRSERFSTNSGHDFQHSRMGFTPSRDSRNSRMSNDGILRNDRASFDHLRNKHDSFRTNSEHFRTNSERSRMTPTMSLRHSQRNSDFSEPSRQSRSTSKSFDPYRSQRSRSIPRSFSTRRDSSIGSSQKPYRPSSNNQVQFFLFSFFKMFFKEVLMCLRPPLPFIFNSFILYFQFNIFKVASYHQNPFRI